MPGYRVTELWLQGKWFVSGLGLRRGGRGAMWGGGAAIKTMNRCGQLSMYNGVGGYMRGSTKSLT